MASIDIALPDELMTALTPPSCDDLKLPSFSSTVPTVTLPIGGSLQGVADFTRGIPTDCSMNFSLMVQLAPIMASMECLLNLLQCVTKIQKALTEATSLTGIIQAVKDIGDALGGLASCLKIVVPIVGTACFIKSILGLIASMLLCAVQSLESILSIMDGLGEQLSAAQDAGNDDLVAALQCAQENANTSATATMQSMQPITVLLNLAQPFLQIAQINLSVSLPSTIDPKDSRATQSMLKGMRTIAQDIKTIADAIKC